MKISLASLTMGFLALGAASSLDASPQSSFQYETGGRPVALSGDGGEVVLRDGTDYCLWVASGTRIPLGSPSVTSIYIGGISSDGATLVGGAGIGGNDRGAARWTQAHGWQSLGSTLTTQAGVVPTAYGTAVDASQDGSRIVGYTTVAGASRPFLWTAATGMVELAGGAGRAQMISDDGLTISGERPGEIVRWNGTGQLIESIPTPPGSFADVRPFGHSAGGDSIVGLGGSLGGFVWNAQTGFVAIGDFNACCPVNTPIGTLGFPLGGWLNSITRSGHLAVGGWYWEPGQFDFRRFPTVWTPGGGVRRLDDELSSRGVDLSGFWLDSADLISSDGDVIVGRAADLSTSTLGWFTARLDLGFGRVFCEEAFPNSTGSTGKLTAQGSAVLSDDDLTLEATSLPANALAMAISSMTIGPPIFMGGTPKLCLYGSVGRHESILRNTGPSGATSFPMDLTAMPQPNGSTISAMVGQTWGFQVWHRDLPQVMLSNMTEGVSVLLH